MSGLTLLLTVVAAVILGLFISYFLSSSDDSHTPTHDHEDVDPEVDYDAMELILSKGYPGEAHWVHTEDGYILGLHRITGPKGAPPAKRPVFFIQHGLICSSTNWLTNLANESFGFILADAGFDVWMGNIRGNTYSKIHRTLNPNQKEFWNFTFDEHSSKDLPAMVNYVLETTGQTELFYVGHSQGTVMGFAGFTVNQTLAKQIKAFFALAPVTTVKHAKGLFAFIGEKLIIETIKWVEDKFGTGEFLPSDALTKAIAEYVCTPELELTNEICGNVLFLIAGHDTGNLNETRLPVYFAHVPAGTSVKNAVHFAQGLHSGRFAMYDYGEKLNKEFYGTAEPPSYNITELSVPTALYTGGHDWLADPTDVNASIPLLNTTGKVFYRKHILAFNHMDFIWGLDAANLVYNDIIRIAKGML